MVAIVNSGSEGRVLDLGGKERGRRRGIRGEKADELKSLSVGAVAGDAVVLGDGLIKCGRDVKKPSGPKL